jgi:hypothetical protein
VCAGVPAHSSRGVSLRVVCFHAGRFLQFDRPYFQLPSFLICAHLSQECSNEEDACVVILGGSFYLSCIEL